MCKHGIAFVGIAVVTALAGSPRAEAATFGEWLAYCVGGDPTIDAKIQTDSMAACGVEKGIKAACSVLSGTPWTCSTPSAKPKEKGEACDELKIEFQIGAGFAMPGTWKVKGEAKAKYHRLAIKNNINICNVAPVIPTPIASGGAYSAESGDISFMVEMKIEGSLEVTSPVGITVNLSAAAGCERTTGTQYFKKAEVNSCGMPTPAPTATTTPTASPSATPTTTPTPPSGSPTPAPTASPPPSSPSATPAPVQTPGM
ncbi:MAG: hypothetical protein HS111_10860 [Kofleriaceae bacterium]|nr:hypothetical protein [Kofleriaceae bacterium]MCL4223308.1 hypothetical protein [Myxococcales bacterium]